LNTFNYMKSENPRKLLTGLLNRTVEVAGVEEL
jgi:hypothetical protein